MAIAYDNASSLAGTAVSSLTFSHINAGDYMFAGAGNYQPGTQVVNSITYNAVGLTEIHESAGTDMNAAIYEKVAPYVGTANVVVTWSAAADEVAAGVVTFSGVHQTTPRRGTYALANGTTTPATVNIASATNDWVIDFVACSNPNGITGGANQTERWSREDVDGFSSYGSSTEPGGATITMSWALVANSEWRIYAVSLIPASGNASVNIIGVSLASAIGSETAQGAANVSETGQALSLAIGNEVITANANVSETGQQLTFNFGSEIITGNANIAETGQALSLAQGNETVTANANVAETGQALVFAQGEESITANADVIETGLALTLAIGNETINSDISIQETGSALSLNQGNETITADANISETGLALTFIQGNETIIADANISETGQALIIVQGEEVVTANANISEQGQALALAIGNETVTATSITQGKKKRRIQRKAVPIYAVKPKEIVNQEIWLNGKDIKIASGKPVIRIDTSIKVKGTEIKNLFGLRDNIGITIDYSQRRKKEQREIMEYLLCA